MGRLLALVAALLAGALLAWDQARPPIARQADAPARAFSAARAMADVWAVGARPHPVGSPENAAVAGYLMGRMAALGLQPQARPGAGLYLPKDPSGRIVGADLVNLVGVLPGRDRGQPALALVAHYDSAPSSPGAADDAAGVATILEAVRAIKARGPPARDVIVLLTDGEEAGLLGAEAFFHRDPLARRVGFVMNFETRGSAGRVQMFQAGPQNGQVIGLLKRTAVRPQATSLAGFVYAHMPNDTDFSIAREAGLPGLNYAFIGRQFDYHSPTATPTNLSLGTLQDMGDQALSTAAALAAAPRLPGRSPDVVYSQLFGEVLLAYPAWGGWLILAAAAAALALAVGRARAGDPFPWQEPAQGFGAAACAVAGAVGALHLARQVSGGAYGYLEPRLLLAQPHRWELALLLVGLGFLLFSAAELARGRRTRVAVLPVLFALASCLLAKGPDLVALTCGAVGVVLGLLAYGRSPSRPGAWTGVLLFGLAVAAVVQALAPPVAVAFAWPLLLACLAALATAASARRTYSGLGALALAGALGVGWIGGVAHLSVLALDLPEILGLSVLLAALLLWPLAQPTEGAPSSRALGPTLMIVGAALVLVIRNEAPWSARHPQASNVLYHLDTDTGRAWLVDLAEPTPWSTAVLRAGQGQIGRPRTWAITGDTRAAPVAPLRLPSPAADLRKNPDATVRVHVTSPPGARVLSVQLRPNTPVRLVSVGGLPADRALKPGAWTRLRWEGGAGGLDIVLRPAGPGALGLRAAALTDHWPAGAPPLPPRPADVAPFDASDGTLVSASRQLTW